MQAQNTDSLSIANPHPKGMGAIQKIGLSFAGLGVLIILISWAGVTFPSTLFLTISLSSIIIGMSVYAYKTYTKVPEGIKNNRIFFNSLTSRGVLGWVVGIILTGFYIALYWYPEFLGMNSEGNRGLVKLFDPLSQFFKGKPASQWFVYGTLYTVTIVSLGIKFLLKYRYNRYQVIRTLVVMSSQLFFAYLIPEILAGLNYNDVVEADGSYLGYYDTDIKNMWPLDYDFFYDWHLEAMQQESYQPLGMSYLVIGIFMSLIGMPVLTYFLGKRWYCSWVCGCGGLAETAGDPFRHLSDKSTEAWQIERVLINAVIVFVTIMTSIVLAAYFDWFTFKLKINVLFVIGVVFVLLVTLLLIQRKKSPYLNQIKSFIAVLSIFAVITIYFSLTSKGGVLTVSTYSVKSWYGFLVGATFSGVIGVGFYPILGNRVWCRFGCPLAGYMGLIQRFKSRFRITTNGGQCISCGNCSTYCEQGIDVRWYAQRGQNIVRSSCVGCGVCSAVCPRGVLKLENGPEEGRINAAPVLVGTESKSE